MATGCPCGATPKSEYGLVDYLPMELIEQAVNSEEKLAKYRGLLVPYIASAIHVQALCLGPRQQMPELTLVDFVNPVTGWPKISQALNSALYPMLCECDECPPIVTCNTGTCLTVTPADGWPRPSEPLLQRQYIIPPGATIWVSRADLVCRGSVDGITITWLVDESFDERLPVDICDGEGNDCTHGWFAQDYGASVTICFDGQPGPSTDPWPEPPAGVADWIGPPTCTTDDICTALEYVYQTIRRTEFLAQVAAGPIYGVTTPYLFNLPGLNSPIQGTLAEALPRALEALAPIQPDQLVDPITVPVGSSSFVELNGEAYALVTFSTVPDWMVPRGEGDSAVYYRKTRDSHPGWLVVMGQEGVIAYHGLDYPEGVEFELPATATSIALHLELGVEVDLTLWDRHV